MREICKQKNRVVQALAKAKQFRRFATRYEKVEVVCLGVAQIVLGFTHVRKLAGSASTP